MLNLARKIFGTSNDRVVKSLRPLVDKINAYEETIEKLSDAELKAQTSKFKKRLENGETLDDLMFEAFATVREAAKRVLGERHYDVQLMGGIVLHQGKIAEMKTGEGKTLVSTLAAYLNALSGNGVHVVTVNDYLATRDAEWMGQVYNALDMTVGIVKHGLNDEERRAAYACDITYGTNNEFGFDYLRDNMKHSVQDMVMRPFNFAIIDEVDSILIDEARTPLIISGPAEDSSELYRAVDKLMIGIEPSMYDKDEKFRTVALTDEGMEIMEEKLRTAGLLEIGGLYDPDNIALVHHVNMALKAHVLFQNDKDYIVKDDEIVIIDEFTGRMMQGRRYGEGLHQAIEAKEGVTIQRENQTLASITFQNYFRLYPKLGGMTGTALTEEAEFAEIYKLYVVAIPTNVPVQRVDYDDEIYRTLAEKNTAIVKLVKDCHERGQPVLVGTTSIEKSEELSAYFKKARIPHNVLNAKQHEREAYIVAQAGFPGSVTIATNMAGRGTDIKLGGNTEMMLKERLKGDENEKAIEKMRQDIRAEVLKNREQVREAGGLFIVGTERHESRRIDNQLRGRSGRQGDIGASKFYLSMQDDLMRIFGSERLDGVLKSLGMKDGEPLIHPWISKAIERAQRKVEAQHFDARKHILKFDDVMNDQRKVIYEQRRELMEADDISETIKDMRDETVELIVHSAIPSGSYVEQWNVEGLHSELSRLSGINLPIIDWAKEEGIAEEEILERIKKAFDDSFAQKEARLGNEQTRMLEKSITLQILDHLWKDHLLTMDHLKQGIQLRSIGQRDPLNEYKSEAFNLFAALLDTLREKITQTLLLIEIKTREEVAEIERKRLEEARAIQQRLQEMHPEAQSMQDGSPVRNQDGGVAPIPFTRKATGPIDPKDPSTWGKVSRNADCPCGSGKKYKHCHGRI